MQLNEIHSLEQGGNIWSFKSASIHWNRTHLIKWNTNTDNIKQEIPILKENGIIRGSSDNPIPVHLSQVEV